MPGRSEGPIGADLLQLDPRGVAPRELGSWLTGQLRAAVLTGRLADGVRLPATRVLASDLGLSRGVVVEAYQRLAEEGLVSAHVGAGTTVTAPRHRAVTGSTAPQQEPTGRWERQGPVGGPSEIDLWPGVPDLTTFPRAAWLRAESAVLAGAGARELGYGDPAGHPVLRAELASWLNRSRGVSAGPEDVVIVAGVAQALTLLAQVLLARGHRGVVVEDPGSWGVRDTLTRWGLAAAAVPVDEHGARIREAPDDVRAAVLTPAHQFPTGVVLAPERRREVLAWAAEREGLVVEDDYDAEFRYDRRPVPALHPGAPGLVVHTGSTSKTLAPGLRLGWMVAPPALRAELVEAKYAADISNATPTQLVFASLLADGAFERHLRLARRRHRARRDALLEGLRGVPGRVHGVPAGLHLLLTLPGPYEPDAETALVERLARAGVRVQPLGMHRTAPGGPGVVLGYAAVQPDRLREAGRRIVSAARALRPARHPERGGVRPEPR